MKVLALLLSAALLAALAQIPDVPLAAFTGTVKQIDSGKIILSRDEQEDMEIPCSHKTRYFSGSHKIKREAISPGARVTLETKLGPDLKPEAVNVRLLDPAPK